MGIEFLIKRGPHVNFVNNLLKIISKDYNFNNNKKDQLPQIVQIQITIEENKARQKINTNTVNTCE